MYDFMAEVASLYRALHDVGETIAATAGLTRTRLACLREVANEPRTVAKVAATQGVARQGVQRTADSLVTDGLATWIHNPQHRRAKLLAPTSSGNRALAVAEGAHAAWVARARNQLPADLEVLTGRMAAVREVVAKRDA